jgi:malate dehydrogenase
MINKISVIGAGRVGETTAQMLAIQKFASEIVLIDLDDRYAQGVALDIQQTSEVFKFDTVIKGSSNISTIKDSNIVIITAGLPRKPGMDRSDVLKVNLKIIDGIMDGVIEHANDAFVIMVTNPVDALTYYACKKTNWDRSRIIGQAGVLDSLRMSSFIAMETGLSINDIKTLVLGGHGDTMVPLTRFTSIGGVPITQLLSADVIEGIIQRTRDGGAEIINLKKNSSAYDAPGAAVTVMVESIVHNKKRLMPCISLLQGEYGQNGLAIGVPVVLGENGIERIIELEFNDEENALFNQSVNVTRELTLQVDKRIG